MKVWTDQFVTMHNNFFHPPKNKKMKWNVIVLLISTLKVVLFSRKLSNFHWLFSFPVTDLMYRNEYSFVPLLFVILTSLPLQYFSKYDCDYPYDDKTPQTLPKLFAKKHFLHSFTRWCPGFSPEKRTKTTTTRGVDVCKVCTCQPRYQFGYMHLIPRLVNHIIVLHARTLMRKDVLTITKGWSRSPGNGEGGRVIGLIFATPL